MAYSADIYNLIDSQPAARDMEWESALLQALPTARFKILNETPLVGPDGWPYLLVGSDPAGRESATKTLSWLSERGIGLVLNPQKPTPDYVLTYGMIWNFRERGEFLSNRGLISAWGAPQKNKSEKPQENRSAEIISFKPGDKIHSGPPSLEYLPEYARAVLRTFFKDNGAPVMRVLVIGEPQGPNDGSGNNNIRGRDSSPQYSLCFSLEAMGQPAATEHKGLLEAISWFLPSHYSLALMSEKDLPAFHDL